MTSDNEFEESIIKYYSRIKNYCGKKTNWHNEHEDLTQIVFLKAKKALPKFKGNSSLYTWFHRIAHNVVIDWYRKDKKIINICLDDLSYDDYSKYHSEKRMMGINPALTESDQTAFREADTMKFIGDPQNYLEYQEMNEEIFELVRGFTEDEKIVFEMKLIDGMSTVEISELSGLSKQFIRENVKIIRQRIRDKLKVTGHLHTGD